jgi:hypothetical protein
MRMDNTVAYFLRDYVVCLCMRGCMGRRTELNVDRKDFSLWINLCYWHLITMQD